jgi:hypothetical protein
MLAISPLASLGSFGSLFFGGEFNHLVVLGIQKDEAVLIQVVGRYIL